MSKKRNYIEKTTLVNIIQSPGGQRIVITRYGVHLKKRIYEMEKITQRSRSRLAVVLSHSHWTFFATGVTEHETGIETGLVYVTPQWTCPARLGHTCSTICTDHSCDHHYEQTPTITP